MSPVILGVVIAPGKTAQLVAEKLLDLTHGFSVQFFSLPLSQIEQTIPDAVTLNSSSVEECAKRLADSGVTHAIYVGGYGGALELRLPERMKKSTLASFDAWEPFATMEKFKTLLEARAIILSSPLEFLPDLSVKPGYSEGNFDTIVSRINFDSAISKAYSEKRLSSQVFIVDEGRVLAQGNATAGTNALIKSFGDSHDKSRLKSPVLCKVASPHNLGVYPPVVGDATIQLCFRHGLKGIIVEAGKTIVMDQERISLRGQRQSLDGDSSVARWFADGSLFFCGLDKQSIDC